MEKTIIALGWTCPKPLIELKKALDQIEEGRVSIKVDDGSALGNISAFAAENGFEITHNEEKDCINITVTKKAGCSGAKAEGKDLLIVISSNVLGVGNDELGASLMKGYLYALTEAAVKPKTLIFMNGGVWLTTEGTPVKESLDLLAEAGTEILSCGACLNFYGIQDKLVKGAIGNMYTFVEKMNSAANTIKI
jgi:selenium metabolism protein YedF